MHSPTSDLTADCANCFGLCCVALAFAKSSDFAVDKAVGEPCDNLQPDFGCGIHSQLRPRGYAGCTVYDCFGAGQKISQSTFGGTSWRDAPQTSSQMFALLPIVRLLHELLWYLTDAVSRPDVDVVALTRAIESTERLSLGTPAELLGLDVEAHRASVNVLLLAASERVRGGLGGADHRGADLMGARLRGVVLRGASLRGAYLIAADLRDADLTFADVIGADFRDARVAGADLSDSLFLSQTQVNAMRGDSLTRLPPLIERPASWA